MIVALSKQDELLNDRFSNRSQKQARRAGEERSLEYPRLRVRPHEKENPCAAPDLGNAAMDPRVCPYGGLQNTEASIPRKHAAVLRRTIEPVRARGVVRLGASVQLDAAEQPTYRFQQVRRREHRLAGAMLRSLGVGEAVGGGGHHAALSLRTRQTQAFAVKGFRSTAVAASDSGLDAATAFVGA
jgi:hypothetical protein